MATIDPRVTGTTVGDISWPYPYQPRTFPVQTHSVIIDQSGRGDDYANEVQVEEREHDVLLTFRRNARVVKRITVPRSLWESLR